MNKKATRSQGHQVAGIVVKNFNRKFNLNEKFIKKVTTKILKLLKKSPSKNLDIVFLSDRAIRPFNKKTWRNSPEKLLLGLKISLRILRILKPLSKLLDLCK